MTQQTKLPSTVSTAELAGLFGVSVKTVSTWAKSGIVERSSYGRFNLARSVRAFAKHHKRSGSEPTVAATVGSERARVLKLQGDRLEQQLKVERKDLVPFSEGVATAAAMTHLFRAGLLAFRTRIGGRLNLSRADSELVYDEACALLKELSQANDYADHLQAVAQSSIEQELAKGDIAAPFGRAA